MLKREVLCDILEVRFLITVLEDRAIFPLVAFLPSHSAIGAYSFTTEETRASSKSYIN